MIVCAYNEARLLPGCLYSLRAQTRPADQILVHKPKHLYSWKTLLRCEKEWSDIASTLGANVDVAVTLYRNGSWSG